MGHAANYDALPGDTASGPKMASIPSGHSFSLAKPKNSPKSSQDYVGCQGLCPLPGPGADPAGSPRNIGEMLIIRPLSIF
jgi:hypothetical protein